ncbi:MAG: transcriptional repressor [Chloroflexi bacterium]|nr:transcriptional repressor [Chloroflexota bacterium]
MVDAQARFEALVGRLREQGCRLTPQRIALLQLLAASDGHPSASHLYDRLHAQFPTTSPATVYKMLNLLKDLGEVLELGFSDDDNRYDGNNPHPHPHLICVRCRKIVDAESSIALDMVQQLSEQWGYQIINHRLDFYGICPACREAEQASG